eukprot:Hpha_TRINITY_DN9635_c0_g1::TRINITY_DN9635_c0_g1_i2::g.184277::m.184277
MISILDPPGWLCTCTEKHCLGGGARCVGCGAAGAKRQPMLTVKVWCCAKCTLIPQGRIGKRGGPANYTGFRDNNKDGFLWRGYMTGSTCEWHAKCDDFCIAKNYSAQYPEWSKGCSQ